MVHTQDDIMLTLSFLRGERTVPTSNTEGRKEFIQQTLHEVYAAFPWKFAEVNATLSVISGIATLPSGVSMEHDINISYMDGSQEVPFEQIDAEDRTKATASDSVFWITNIDGQTMQLNTYRTVSQLLMNYQGVEPQINATIGTPYPDRLTIALGANRFVKLSEDPDADLAQDDTLFVNRLNSNISTQNRPRPKRVRRTAQSETGSYTGEI